MYLYLAVKILNSKNRIIWYNILCLNKLQVNLHYLKWLN